MLPKRSRFSAASYALGAFLLLSAAIGSSAGCAGSFNWKDTAPPGTGSAAASLSASDPCVAPSEIGLSDTAVPTWTLDKKGPCGGDSIAIQGGNQISFVRTRGPLAKPGQPLSVYLFYSSAVPVSAYLGPAQYTGLTTYETRSATQLPAGEHQRAIVSVVWPKDTSENKTPRLTLRSAAAAAVSPAAAGGSGGSASGASLPTVHRVGMTMSSMTVPAGVKVYTPDAPL